MTGLEHLEAAQATGRGVLLLSAHFNSIEIGCRALAARMPLNVMYRPTKNLLIGEFVHSRRAVQTRRAIPRDDVRTLIKALKDGDVVWYAPDQSFRKKGAEMVTLFGIPAATNTATSRIARMTNALVLPYFFERLPGGGYRGTIHPPLENFPTDDPVADTERFNRIVEAEVRRMPAQYLWIHRRFKGLTPDYPNTTTPGSDPVSVQEISAERNALGPSWPRGARLWPLARASKIAPTQKHLTRGSRIHEASF